jgi:DNA-binding MarR family transcriptional regulator
MSDQGAAKIVNEMEERGYLQKHADAGDGRIKKLMLSKRGLAALQAARQFHQTYEETLARSLPARRLATTRHVLEAMVAKTGGDAEHARLRAM